MANSNGVNPIMAAGRDQASRDLTNSLDEGGAGKSNAAVSAAGVSAAVLAASVAVLAALL